LWNISSLTISALSIAKGMTVIIMGKVSTEEAVKELTLLLMYLNRFSIDAMPGSEPNRAWKNYSFGVVNKLDEENYITQGKSSTKSVYLTEKGFELARELLEKYGVKDWK